MAIKTADLNAKLFGKSNKRRVISKQQAQSAAQAQTPIIELVVAGEDAIEFELVKIPATEIKIKTQVFAQNAREQAFLNELALADILQTLKDKGQQFPAVGRWTCDGKIEVLDGSRRRMACILAKQQFLIYVAKDINSSHAKFLSDVANAHKPLSLFERGREMQLLLDSGKVKDQKSLAKLFNCNEAIVSGALKAATLPLELLKAYPCVADLGRPTVVKLHKIYSSMQELQQKEFLNKLPEKNLWENLKVQGVSRKNREITAKIIDIAENLVPTNVKHNKKENAQINTSNNGKIKYSHTAKETNLYLKDLNQTQFAQLLEYVQKLVG